MRDGHRPVRTTAGAPLACQRVHPEMRFVVGSTQVAVSLHALAIVVAVAVGASIALRRAREPAFVLLAVPVVAVAGLIGARALHATLHGGGGVWTGGLASTGGIAAGFVAACLIARASGRPIVDLLDPLAPAAIVALGIGRIGCFLGGCCYGRPTSLPWGVLFPALGPTPRHPLQLYSAAGDFVVAAMLLACVAPPGAITRRACMGLGVLRFALEVFRDPGATDLLAGGRVTVPQAAALVLVAASLRIQGASTMAPPRRSAADAG